MEKINDGGPAFPMARVTVLAEDGTPNEVAAIMHGGMSLRDYFAAKAMQGIVSSIDGEGNYQRLRGHAANVELSVSQWIALNAYKQADAMIEARVSHA